MTCPRPTLHGPCGGVAWAMDRAILTDLIARTTTERVRYVCGAGHSFFADTARPYRPLANRTPEKPIRRGLRGPRGVWIAKGAR